MPPPPARPNAFTGGYAYVSSNPGGQTAVKRANENVKDPVRKGPLASPNTHTSLLPTNRHKVYQKRPDHLVQPVAVLPEPHGRIDHLSSSPGMDAADQALADCAPLCINHPQLLTPLHPSRK